MACVTYGLCFSLIMPGLSKLSRKDHILWPLKKKKFSSETVNVRSIFADVSTLYFSEQIGEQLENIIELIKKSMTGPALSFYEREFDFFHQITDISRIIKWVSFCAMRRLNFREKKYFALGRQRYVRVSVEYVLWKDKWFGVTFWKLLRNILARFLILGQSFTMSAYPDIISL